MQSSACRMKAKRSKDMKTNRSGTRNQKKTNIEPNDIRPDKRTFLEEGFDRVLALSLRPTCFDDLVGQKRIVSSVKNQLESGRVPHFFIIAGPVGAGKTTLARILATCFRGPESADVLEINAANKTGIDDVRDLVDKMRYRPVYPKRCKVVILDEAHQLSNAAQNALNTETEDVADHVFYIFCTSAVNKIIPSLKRRAFVVNPEPLNDVDVKILLKNAAQAIGKDVENDESLCEQLDELTESISDAGITSPGLVLQAAERLFSGMTPRDSVWSIQESKIDPLELCRAVSSGQWANCCMLLREATKNDVPALRNSALGYLKAILLKSVGNKALNLSRAIQHLSIDCIRIDDGAALPLFLSSVCLACDAVNKMPKSNSNGTHSYRSK